MASVHSFVSRHLATVGLVTVLGVVSPTAAASQGDEPMLDRLRSTFQTDYLSLGTLLQTVADFQIDRSQPGDNGFSVANFRLALYGELDGGFGYFLQTNFVGQPAILDARLSFRPSEHLTLMAGQFKAPFSFELLTPASSIDFVNRSQVVAALAPARQIGMQITGSFADRALGFSAGAFNGNGTGPNSNDSNDLLYVGRVFATRPLTDDDEGPVVQAGANVAFSRDESASFGSGFVTGYTGYRTVVGVDVRATVDQYLLSGEVIGSWLDAEFGPTRKPWGLHLTGGYMITEVTQVLVRWDGFQPDDGSGRSDWVVIGANVWPTGATEFQVNYVVDAGDAAPDRHQLLVNFQIGF